MNYQSVNSREQCPSCDKNGRDKHKDNLVVYGDGGKHCFSCNYHESSSGSVSYQFDLPHHISMPDSGHSTRSLRLPFLNKYRVVNQADDEVTVPLKTGGFTFKRTPKLIYPYFNEKGVLIGAKIIDYSVPKDQKGRFTWVGDFKQATVFGSHLLGAANTKATNLLICEGENDTIAAAQCLSNDWVVVGISGTGSVERIKSILTTVRKYNRIVVCMDNDDAGNEARDKLVEILPVNKTYIVSLPVGVKDINDLVMAGREGEVSSVVKSAKQILPQGIVPKDDIVQRTMNHHTKTGISCAISTGIKSFDTAFGGLSPGRLITVVGDTGIGKSTLVENMCLAAAKQGKHSFVLSLEMPDVEVVTRMVQTILKQPLYSNPSFDFSRLNQNEYRQALDFVCEYVHFYKHTGSLNTNTIIDVMNYAVDVFDVGVIVLDNYTSASESLDWQDIDTLAQRLKNDVALARNVCVIGVSHVSRDGSKEGEVPQLRSMRGGNGIAHQSDVVIAIGRNREEPTTKVSIIKNRISGKFTNFTYKFVNYDIVEDLMGQVELPNYQDHQYNQVLTDDQTTGKTDNSEPGSVPQPVRDECSSVTDTDSSLRIDQDIVQTNEDIQTRLPATERDIHRDQGNIHSRGQEENGRDKIPTPRVRYTLPISKWLWETEKDNTTTDRSLV
jgi:twinkle protein